MTFTHHALNSPLAPFIPGTLSFHAVDGTLCPINYGVLPEKEWNELCKAVAAFYSRFDAVELERLRQEVAKEPERHAPPVLKNRAGFVYLIRGSRLRYKIGRTANIKNRMTAFTVSSADEISLVYSFQSKDCHKAEAGLHEMFAEKRKHGEWFALSQQDIKTIKAIQDFQM